MKLVDILIILLMLSFIVVIVAYFSGYFRTTYIEDPYIDTPLDRIVRDGNYYRLANTPFYNRGPRRWVRRWGRRWPRRWFRRWYY